MYTMASGSRDAEFECSRVGLMYTMASGSRNAEFEWNPEGLPSVYGLGGPPLSA